MTALAGCLRAAFGPRVRLYPREAAELGGTTNSVGRALRAIGFAGFVHLELDPATRAALDGDGGVREAVLGCLGPQDAPFG